MMEKGEAPILSGVLYTGIVITGIIIIVLSLKPYLELKKTEMELDASFLCVNSLANAIEEMIYAVPGSSKEVRCSFKKGVISVGTNSLIWDVQIPVSYDMSKFKGWKRIHLVNTTERSGYYLLYNKIIEINITAIGDENNKVFYNVSKAFNYLKNKKYGYALSNKFRFFLDNESCESGYGYTYIRDELSLGMHVEPAECMAYDLIFILDDEHQDFVRIFVSF